MFGRERMPALRGERSESGRLPELRRHWIHCEACGPERPGRGRCIYPCEMPGLRWYWPEAPEFSHRRGLTARPAVLTNVRGRAVLLPVLMVDGPARTAYLIRLGKTGSVNVRCVTRCPQL